MAKHDLRRYRQFVDIFEKIEKGKKLIKEGKKEYGEKLVREGEQTLRAIFVDQVDIHTGEGISLRSIAPRWPTIISDFLKLEDKHTDPSQIAKDLNVTEAEGVVLATKNKLYLEWRDNLFKPAVLERYKNLLTLVEARRNSIREYKEMAKPIIARYKMLKDALQIPKVRGTLLRSFFRPDAQAITIDTMRLWAWKPIAPVEKYKVTREVLDKVSLRKAGFTSKEINFLKEHGVKKDEISALPVIPMVDNVVRVIVKNIEKRYGVVITPLDVYNVVEELAKYYTQGRIGFGGGEAWFFSPYFVFLEIPMTRLVIRMPDGAQAEVLEIKWLTARAKTQNIILGHLLELKARERVLERDIHSLLGDFVFKEDTKKWIETESFLKEEYPELYGKASEVMSLEPPMEKENWVKKTEKWFKKIGWNVSFVRGYGPYELAFKDRMTKFYFVETGKEFGKMKKFIDGIFGVP